CRDRPLSCRARQGSRQAHGCSPRARPSRGPQGHPSAGAQSRLTMLVLDSGGVTLLSERSRQAAASILTLREEGLWPPLVPSVVLVECLQGHAGRDANANRLLKMCDVIERIPEPLARRAAHLRRLARTG